jgi:hypothetical protein
VERLDRSSGRRYFFAQRCALTWFVLTAVACNEEGRRSAVEPRPFRAEMQSWCAAEQRGITLMTSLDVPPAPWPGAVQTSNAPQAVNVTISHAGIDIDGRRPDGALEAVLDAARADREGAAQVAWTLLPTAGAKLSDIESTLRLLRTSIGPKGSLQFSLAGATLPEPPNEALHEVLLPQLVATSPAGRNVLMERSMITPVKRCPRLEMVFARAAQGERSSRCSMLAASLPDVLAACPEHANEVMAWVYLVFLGSGVPRADLEVRVADDQDLDAAVLEHAGGVWGDVADQWFATPPTRPIRLRRIE